MEEKVWPEENKPRTSQPGGSRWVQLDLASVFCTQLSLGVDVPIQPSDLGRLRDTVQAMYPTAMLPWYFRETYTVNGRPYQLAASLGASRAGDPRQPYNVYLQLTLDPQTEAYPAPTVLTLLAALQHEEPAFIFCTVRYTYPPGAGSPRYDLPMTTFEEDDANALQIRGLRMASLDEKGQPRETITVERLDGDEYQHSVSFYEIGPLRLDLPERVLQRASALSRRLHRAPELPT